MKTRLTQINNETNLSFTKFKTLNSKHNIVLVEENQIPNIMIIIKDI